MATILTVNKSFSGIGSGKNPRESRKSASVSCNVFRARKSSDVSRGDLSREENGFKKAIFIAGASVILSGAFYLYQVNDLASRGYEIKEEEAKIANLKAAYKKNKIQEVELRSMYNIEKAIKELDLVSANDISYLELPGPVAMK